MPEERVSEAEGGSKKITQSEEHRKKLIEIKLIINVMLLSGVQKSDLVIDIIFKFFSNMVYYRILNKLAWAVQ